MHLSRPEHFGVNSNPISMEIDIGSRFLREVGGNIDIAIIAICGVAWALAGFPYFTKVIVFGGAVISFVAFALIAIKFIEERR
jgi:hypothetical protein